MKKKPILLDQYHIDIHCVDKLTKEEVKLVAETFMNTNWLSMYVAFQFPTNLRKKLRITITT